MTVIPTSFKGYKVTKIDSKESVLNNSIIDLYVVKMNGKDIGQFGSYDVGGEVNWEYILYKQDSGDDLIDDGMDALEMLVDDNNG